MTEATVNSTILVVDDDERNLRLMVSILQGSGYSCQTAGSGMEALKKTRETEPALIFLDIMMPEMDGYEVCRRLKEDGSTRNIPVVMVTALEDRDSRIRGLEAGAIDFLTKPVDTLEIVTRARNLLKIREYEDLLEHYNENLEAEVARKTAELVQAHEKLKKGSLDSIIRLTIIAEYKDEETAAHIKRVGVHAAHMAKCLGWSDEDCECILYAAPMHDIGKVGIPAEVLLKRGPLNAEEFTLMKNHTIIGGRILNESVSKYLQMGEQIARSHHERWDGSGYPKGLKGEEIPIVGRIMNIIDQYDALRSIRPYKPALSHETVTRIIIEGDGRTMPHHFDPQLHEIFKREHKMFEEIFERMRD